jgi:hypothetical protein
MTPVAVHYGDATRLFTERQQTLATAYTAHPERFVKGQPCPPALPTAVWINPPKANPPVAVAGAMETVGKSEPNVSDDLHYQDTSITPFKALFPVRRE